MRPNDVVSSPTIEKLDPFDFKRGSIPDASVVHHSDEFSRLTAFPSNNNGWDGREDLHHPVARSASTPPSQLGYGRHSFQANSIDYPSSLTPDMIMAMRSMSVTEDEYQYTSRAAAMVGGGATSSQGGGGRPLKISTAAYDRIYSEMNTNGQLTEAELYQAWEMRNQLATPTTNTTRMYTNNAGDLAGLPGSPSRTPISVNSQPFFPGSPSSSGFGKGQVGGGGEVPEYYDLRSNNKQRHNQQQHHQMYDNQYSSTGAEYTSDGGSSSRNGNTAAAPPPHVNDKKLRTMLAQQQQIWMREQMFKRDFMNGNGGGAASSHSGQYYNNHHNGGGSGGVGGMRNNQTRASMNSGDSRNHHPGGYSRDDSPSAATPSGDGVRSALLEEFRSSKNKKYDLLVKLFGGWIRIVEN